jgi:hypothetical protein
MEDATVEGLRAELALLEAQEALLSAQRGHLHNQIDFGYASDATRTHEREISDKRRQLHRRIEELREPLHTPEPA